MRSTLTVLLLAAAHVQGSLEANPPPDVAAALHFLPNRATPGPAWKAPPAQWANPRGLHVHGADGEGGLLLPPSPPRALPQRRRTDAQSATPGASLDFSLAPGEIIEVEEQPLGHNARDERRNARDVKQPGRFRS